MAASVRPRASRPPLYRDLSFQVILGMALGVLVGHLFPQFGPIMRPLGDAFLRLIHMIVGPIIFCSVVAGIAGVGDLKKVGRVAIVALIYFQLVTTLALVIGLVSVNILQPGVGMNVDVSTLQTDEAATYIKTAREFVSTSDFLLNIIPRTFVAGFAEGDVLQILFTSVLFGFGLAAAGERGRPVVEVIDSFATGIFWIIRVIMRLSPLAAFGAIGFTVSRFGLEALLSLGKLVFVFYLTCTLFVLCVLWPIARSFGFSLFKLMRYIRSELLLVIGTSSSESVFPQLLRKLEQLGVERSVVGLVLPASYSFNDDGTALYHASVTVFLAQATNTALGWQQQLALLAVLLITSKGGAGVAGSALAVLAATLAATNTIPVASMALILGVHRLLSSVFVFVNILGSAVATLVVATREKALDRARLLEELARGYALPDPTESTASERPPALPASTPGTVTVTESAHVPAGGEHAPTS